MHYLFYFYSEIFNQKDASYKEDSQKHLSYKLKEQSALYCGIIWIDIKHSLS